MGIQSMRGPPPPRNERVPHCPASTGQPCPRPSSSRFTLPASRATGGTDPRSPRPEPRAAGMHHPSLPSSCCRSASPRMRETSMRTDGRRHSRRATQVKIKRKYYPNDRQIHSASRPPPPASQRRKTRRNALSLKRNCFQKRENEERNTHNRTIKTIKKKLYLPHTPQTNKNTDRPTHHATNRPANN